MARPKRLRGKQADSIPRAVIYARVSTKEQLEEGYSVDAQLALLRRYCEAEGLIVEAEFLEAETAKSSGRPRFNALIRLVRQGKAQHIVGEKTDRIYRNFADHVKVDELIEKFGAVLHLVKEGETLHKDSRSHEKLVHGIKLVMSKNYIDNLREETRKGMREKALQGMWPSACPTGYRNLSIGSRRTIEPDPELAPIIRRIFETIVKEGISIRDATLLAKTWGWRGRNGMPASKSTIQYALRNPVMYGRIVWDDIDRMGTFEPVMGKELWEQVQAVMDGRNSNPPTYGEIEYLYRGLIQCGICGCQMSPYRVKKHVYYACTGARGCPRHSMREDRITSAVTTHLEGLRINPSLMSDLRRALKEAHSSQAEHSQKLRDEVQQRASTARKRLERLYLDRIDNKVPDAAYSGLQSQFEEQLREAELELGALGRAEERTWEDGVALLQAASVVADRFQAADAKGRRTIFKSMVSNAQIAEGKLTLELRSWFKLALEAGAEATSEGVTEGLCPKWLPD